MKRSLLALVGAFSLSACAQPATPPKASTDAAPTTMSGQKMAPGSADARARDAILKLSSKVRIDRIGPAPVAGFREAVVGGQTLYISDDGKYMLQGSLFDMEAKKDLSQDALSSVRRDLLKTIPVSDRIVFASPNPKYTVAVFTDVECGFCRKLHSQIADYNKAGITVEYLAFPRMGIGTPDYDKMVSVWCAPDRKKALTDAKNDATLPKRTCKNPVTAEYDLGQRAGLTGTPMIIAENGVAMPGYLPPAELRAELDKLAAARGRSAGQP